jgi:repressor LexA
VLQSFTGEGKDLQKVTKMREVYKNIRRRREALGLSQTELAERVGYSGKSTIAKIEAGIVDLGEKKLERIANALNTTSAELMGMTGIISQRPNVLPLYGSVCAGDGIFADDRIEEWIDAGNSRYSKDTHFILRIKGESMIPDFQDGDLVIVRKQDTAEDGDIVIAIVNGDEGVCKKFKKYKGGMALVSLNPLFEPRYFSEEEVTGIPVRIVGKVVELKRTF